MRKDLGCRLEVLGDSIPIYKVPERVDIFGAAVLVLEVVGVFPDVEAEDGRVAFGKDRVLIGGSADMQGAIFESEPSPAGPEVTSGSGGKGIFKVIKGAKSGV